MAMSKLLQIWISNSEQLDDEMRLKKNSDNVIQCMVFYEKLRPRYINKGDTVSEYDKLFLKSLAINGGSVRLKTMQSSRIVRFVCNMAKAFWEKLSYIQKYTMWCLVLGFYDITMDIDRTIKRPSPCSEYLMAEKDKGRLVDVDSKFLPYKNIICTNIFEISESKLNQETKLMYKKSRFVCDGTLSNAFLAEIGKNLAYTFNTCESLFKDLSYYNKLIGATLATVVDKKDFYRDIYMIPSAVSFVCDNDGKLFCDLYAKMGSKYSSAFSQLTSNMIDWLFNEQSRLNGDNITSISLQDDTLFLQRCPINLDDVVNLNQKLGFTLNQKKLQINQRQVTWSGYTLHRGQISKK